MSGDESATENISRLRALVERYEATTREWQVATDARIAALKSSNRQMWAMTFLQVTALLAAAAIVVVAAMVKR